MSTFFFNLLCPDNWRPLSNSWTLGKVGQKNQRRIEPKSLTGPKGDLYLKFTFGGGIFSLNGATTEVEGNSVMVPFPTIYNYRTRFTIVELIT